MSEQMLGWIETHLPTHARPLPLLGCPRRNAWSTPWTSDSAIAVLDTVGLRTTLVWLGRNIDVHTAPDGNLLLWRGGPWQDWWIEDAETLAAMVQSVSNIRAIGVYVLHEVDGQTHVRYVETPAERVQTAYAELMERWTKDSSAPPRIRRDSDKAKYLCWRCPAKKRCEASDMESGETKDWL